MATPKITFSIHLDIETHSILESLQQSGESKNQTIIRLIKEAQNKK